jgi:hypothetical protein
MHVKQLPFHTAKIDLRRMLALPLIVFGLKPLIVFGLKPTSSDAQERAMWMSSSRTLYSKLFTLFDP